MHKDLIIALATRVEMATHRKDYHLANMLVRGLPKEDRRKVDIEAQRIAQERREANPPT